MTVTALQIVFHISIHALHVEGDCILVHLRELMRNFNPRPPCGGRRLVPESKIIQVMISIHALHVEGDLVNSFPDVGRDISIHALHVEGDQPPV